ncbi:cytochrome P450 [Tessaracoccus terricola]
MDAAEAAGPGVRRAHNPRDTDGAGISRERGIWRIRSVAAARQVLRERNRTTQAGFTAEHIPKGVLRHHPILISDGPLHDEQRAKVGRFFAPKVVREHHLPHIEETAERLLTGTDGADAFALDELALRFSVEVTSRIVGLTESPVDARAARLEAFFRQPPVDMSRRDLGRTRRQWMQAAGRALGPLLGFHLRDVRPAIRERRRNPRPDVVSHLIAEGYTDLDILVECVTYGTAGMVTTREFITMAAWHLLSDDELRAHYLAAPEGERHAVLNEVIRLEPVVGHLYRRATEPFPVSDGEHRVEVAAGDLLDVCVRHTNTEAATVGAEPFTLRPGRELPRGVDPSVMTFGDGAHRCPGQPLAITETDVLLTRLLARRPEVLAEPELGWDDLIEGYRLRGLVLRNRDSGGTR